MTSTKSLKQSIREGVERSLVREQVRRIVESEVRAYAGRRMLREAEDSSDDSGTKSKRKTVMQMLQSPYIDCAQLAYKVMHPQDEADKDSIRSEFSKKKNGTPDADGYVREFSDEEIAKLYELLRSR